MKKTVNICCSVLLKLGPNALTRREIDRYIKRKHDEETRMKGEYHGFVKN